MTALAGMTENEPKRENALKIPNLLLYLFREERRPLC